MEKVLEALARAADGACGVEQAQRIVFWNTAAERTMGYKAVEVRGRACYEIFCGKPYPGCHECRPDCPVMLATQQQQMVPAYNILSRTKHGATLLLNVSVVVPPASDSALAAILLFRDVTHQLHYESYVAHVLRAAVHLPTP
jgi:PAS domain S-box-containing protein